MRLSIPAFVLAVTFGLAASGARAQADDNDFKTMTPGAGRVCAAPRTEEDQVKCWMPYIIQAEKAYAPLSIYKSTLSESENVAFDAFYDQACHDLKENLSPVLGILMSPDHAGVGERPASQAMHDLLADNLTGMVSCLDAVGSYVGQKDAAVMRAMQDQKASMAEAARNFPAFKRQ